MDGEVLRSRWEALLAEVGQAQSGNAPRGCAPDRHDQSIACEVTGCGSCEEDDAVRRGADESVRILEEDHSSYLTLMAGGTKHARAAGEVRGLQNVFQQSHRTNMQR